jgi:hypothetical protein
MQPTLTAPAGANAGLTWSPALSRLALGLILAAGIAAGALGTSPHASALAIAKAGPDLTRLLRAMAAIKLLIAVPVTAAIFWRLGSAIALPWFAAYALAAAAMAAAPGLIWSMAHVGLGAMLLHGGLLATILLLWRDKAMAARLDAIISARRSILARR